MTKLKKIRLSKNISREKLSEISGISIRTIEGYEQKRRNINNSSVNTMIKLADALECDFFDILEN